LLEKIYKQLLGVKRVKTLMDEGNLQKKNFGERNEDFNGRMGMEEDESLNPPMKKPKFELTRTTHWWIGAIYLFVLRQISSICLRIFSESTDSSYILAGALNINAPIAKQNFSNERRGGAQT
jgi:hypothetical protein